MDVQKWSENPSKNFIAGRSPRECQQWWESLRRLWVQVCFGIAGRSLQNSTKCFQTSEPWKSGKRSKNGRAVHIFTSKARKQRRARECKIRKRSPKPLLVINSSRGMRSKSRASVFASLYFSGVWLPALWVRASFCIAPTCMYVLGVRQRLWKSIKEFLLLPSKGGRWDSSVHTWEIPGCALPFLLLRGICYSNFFASLHVSREGWMGVLQTKFLL